MLTEAIQNGACKTGSYKVLSYFSLTELIKSLRLIIDEKAFQEQVDYLTKKLFGSSSERRTDDIPGQQNLFDEAEVEQDLFLLEEQTIIRKHTRKKKAAHEDLFKGLQVEKAVIPLLEEDHVCPVCSMQMVLIGEEYVHRELEFIPATCKVIEYYSQSYGCPSCKDGLGDTEKPVIVKSQVPQALAGKGPASSSAVAWTMYQRYANRLPLYRQKKDWKQYGAQISRTTLANRIIHCSRNYFQPMYDYFHRELLKRSFAMADATRIQVLKEEDRRAQVQSFIWLFRSDEDGRCSFTNNLSENAIRPFAVGRKNWLFSNSVEGDNTSAVVYTMVEITKAHDLNIYGYLKFLLDHQPTKVMTEDQLKELTPWNKKLQSIKNRM